MIKNCVEIVLLFAIVLSAPACQPSPEDVVEDKVKEDSGCTQGVEVTCESGKIFHSAMHYDCQVKACDETYAYQCCVPYAKILPVELEPTCFTVEEFVGHHYDPRTETR